MSSWPSTYRRRFSDCPCRWTSRDRNASAASPGIRNGARPTRCRPAPAKLPTSHTVWGGQVAPLSATSHSASAVASCQRQNGSPAGPKARARSVCHRAGSVQRVTVEPSGRCARRAVVAGSTGQVLPSVSANRVIPPPGSNPAARVAPGVKPIPLVVKRSRAAARIDVRLQHGHVQPRLRQQRSRRQPADPCADHNNSVHFPHSSFQFPASSFQYPSRLPATIREQPRHPDPHQRAGQPPERMAFECCLDLIQHVGRPVVHVHVGVTVRPRRERPADLAVGETCGRRVSRCGPSNAPGSARPIT